MKILLLGKNGQVGWELQRSLAPLGELIALDRSGAAGLTGDLGDIQGLIQTIRTLQPDVLVNAAAYTAVDRAEDEQQLALRVNGEAPRAMAEAMAELNGWLIHYSTDYVFDGSGCAPWREDDRTSPINYYGLSKLQGEQAIRHSGCDHLIFRTSWVYGMHGNNFAKTILKLAKERKQLQIIDDQMGAPTGADLIADVTAHALRSILSCPKKQGIYHLAPEGETSWYGYACLMIETTRNNGIELAVETVVPIGTNSYKTIAKRPLNSRLNSSRLKEQFHLCLPHWESGVTRMLQEITAN